MLWKAYRWLSWTTQHIGDDTWWSKMVRIVRAQGSEHGISAAEVAWTDTLFGVMQALRWHQIAHGGGLGPLHKVPGIGRPSGRV